MQVNFRNGVFFVRGAYKQREALKSTGFRWHPEDCAIEGCKACKANITKAWWTDKTTTAAKFDKFLDQYARTAVEAIGKEIEASRATDADIIIPAPPGFTFKPYQKAGIAYASTRSGVLLADEMGLGKTVQGLGLVNYDPTIKNVLVVCPNNLRINWQREAQAWLTRKFKIHVVEENVAPPEDANLIICSYERVGERYGNNVFAALMQRRFDLQIVDECHYLKNPEAQRTIAVLGKRPTPEREDQEAEEEVPGLVSRARKNLFLTGTPILSRPIEMYPILAALSIVNFGSYWQYATRYCAAHQRRYTVKGQESKRVVWEVGGASHLDELQDKLRSTVMVRRKKSEVLKELPPKTRQVIVLPADYAKNIIAQEQKEFEPHRPKLVDLQAELDLAQARGDTVAFEDVGKRLKAAKDVAFHELTKTRVALAEAKVPAVIEHIDNMLASGIEKIVVFIHHHEVARRLQEHFGNSAVTFTGETRGLHERQDAVDRFQDPKSGVKVFIGSIGAAGVGQNLTAASHVVFAELDWVPALLVQAEDRCHRIGTLNNVLVQYLVIDGSLDARMIQTIIKKMNIADKALDFQSHTRVTAVPVETAVDHPEKYPPASSREKSAVREALREMVRLNGSGFTVDDSALGKRLGASTQLTDGEIFIAKKLLRKYSKQLPLPVAGALGWA